MFFFLFSFSFLIAHSFGRRMLYPGSVGLLQKAMRPMLQGGQAKLIEEVKGEKSLLPLTINGSNKWPALPFLFLLLCQYDGERNKLVACDGNEIDTMFVDRRKDGGPRGRTLVNVENDLFFCSPGPVLLPTKLPSYNWWLLKCATGHLLWGERWLLWGGLHEHTTGGWEMFYLTTSQVFFTGQRLEKHSNPFNGFSVL